MQTTCKAIVLTRRGGPEVLQPAELPIPQPGAGEVRLRVKAAGVGATDLIMLTGDYAYASKIPFVPGYEVAGVVDAVGAGVTALAVGQRVAGLVVRKNPQPFREDLAQILELLAQGRIAPLTERRLALAETRQAIEPLASGSVVGKLVVMVD